MHFIAGANELAVQKAKAEITRLIKEELIRLVTIINYYYYGINGLLLMRTAFCFLFICLVSFCCFIDKMM